jgi:protease-4
MKKALVAVSLTLLLGASLNNYFNKNSFKASNTLQEAQFNNLASKPNIAKINITLTEKIDFDKVLADLSKAAKDKSISAILLFVENYGGEVVRFSVLHDMIKEISKIKPVVTYAVAAASGGYLACCGSSYIVGSSVSCIGSIGVYQVLQKQKGFGHSQDMDVEIITPCEFKALEHPNLKLSDRQKKHIKSKIDHAYQRFLEIVCEDRKTHNLTIQDYKKWAEGQIFDGNQAKELGLIDEVGTLFTAERKICELLSLDNQTELNVIDFCSRIEQPVK